MLARMEPTAHPSVTARLASLSADQRAAATATPGPVLCVAPAGSGKTTTLVARVAWLVDGGTDPATIAAITFNRRAAEELETRIDAALTPLGPQAGAVRVRTFHALGREILRAAGRPVEPLVDRDRLLRALPGGSDPAWRRRMDDAISRRRLDPDGWTRWIAGLPPAEVAGLEAAIDEYVAAVRATGGVDFDDLVADALAFLRADPASLAAWRARCAHLLVDEVQDVDASQLAVALLLAAPANNAFFVGDDDQSIYGWRLADVRRVIGLADRIPGLRRFDLVVNRRCPGPVVDRAVRLVSHNAERFVKVVHPRPGATGRLVLVPEGADEQRTLAAVMDGWPDAGTHAILARTNRELLVGMAIALERRLPFRADRIPDLASDPRVDAILDAADRQPADLPLAARLLRAGARPLAAAEGPPPGADPEDGPADGEILAAILAWAARHHTLEGLRTAVLETRGLLTTLGRDDAPLTLATVHATKGLEFDDVAVLGMSRGRFPSDRSVARSADPARTLEEERRLAYVAWTRARRSLALVFDAAAPSSFLLEAFDVEDLPRAGHVEARDRQAGRGPPEGSGSSPRISERAPPPPRPARPSRAGRRTARTRGRR
jgi:superfamily I DNA/RNA helicase